MSPNPGDRFVYFNDAGLTNDQIAVRLSTLYSEGSTGPIATKFNPSDGSTTYFVGSYAA